MLLTENTTNDTCQSNLRGAWNDVSAGTQKLRLLSASSLSVYILSVIKLGIRGCKIAKRENEAAVSVDLGANKYGGGSHD